MKWALKIAAKLILARLPVPYAYWKSIGIFRHGRMDSVDYPLKIFRLHADRAFPTGLMSAATLLELGPGDSIASAIIGAAYGAKRIYLIDVGDFAKKDVAFYKSLAAALTTRGLSVPSLSHATSFADVLQACNAEYITDGLSGLKRIPTNSIDFAWSHSVLEHVRKQEFVHFLLELRRILKPGAYASHNIDFQDHLAGALNNLRFAERTWESAFFVNSGFYTNRIPAIAMHQMFETVGFEIALQGYGRWPQLPTPRRAMHRDFRRYDDETLCIRTSHALLRKPTRDRSV